MVDLCVLSGDDRFCPPDRSSTVLWWWGGWWLPAAAVEVVRAQPLVPHHVQCRRVSEPQGARRGDVSANRVDLDGTTHQKWASGRRSRLVFVLQPLANYSPPWSTPQ